MSALKPIEWTGNAARIIDQTALPTALSYEDITTPEAMFTAIRELKVRGAPLIGISAAYGLYLAVAGLPSDSAKPDLIALLRKNADYLAGSRPTAVNLFWALERMKRRATALVRECDGVDAVKAGLLEEAKAIHDEDRRMCRAIGENGYELLKGFSTLHTHCNAGALATSELGTALSPMYIAMENRRPFHVFVDETRPLLQGARITAFELMKAGIPVTLICDNMAGAVMAQGKVDAVIVGADRIAANGDVANKIGTYGLALIAKAHNVPFYVAAPSSTFDATLDSGADIPIEERAPMEITYGMGRQTAPSGVEVYNPAFDVTPHRLIAGIITEEGVLEPPYDLRALA
ncbi:MAG: S-methyl-5-thioribose-1-phosphate isomerase [Chitinivibrionales bacterium]|nr:S-methyl-5-thioribose-1-phosphate isomerase [Chitinivibrionales bacterium]